MKIMLIPLAIIGIYIGTNMAIIVGMATFSGKVIEQAYIAPPGTSAIDQPSGGLTKVLPDYSVQPAKAIQSTIGVE